MESILYFQISKKVRKSFFALVLFFSLFSGNSYAQQLSGTYSIGSSADYPTFTDAVSALTINGISGPVIFNIQNGTYTEQVTIGAIPGASEVNTVTFQSQSGNPADVEIQHSAVAVADNFVIQLDNAANIILRNFTIQSQGTAYARTIFAQNAIQNILIEGSHLIAPLTTTVNFERGNVVLTPTTSENIRFIDNQITGGSNGIYFRGGTNSSFRGAGIEVSNNTISEIYSYGIYLDRLTGAVVEDNRVTMRATSWSSSYTLELSEVEGATRVVGNRLFGARQYGLNMQFCNAVEGSPALVANNMIGSSSGGQTVFMYYNTHVNFYHNSVLNTAAGEAIQYNGTGSTGNRIKNNIFRANTGQAVYVGNSTGLVELDYNDLFTSGTYVGRWGSSYAGDVLEWRTLSSLDANSISFDPQFVSDTDLTASSPALANAGTPLAEVTTDINGVARKATPSMGANEYDSEGLSPLSGTYTVDPEGSGDRNFTAIQSTVDAMILNGIEGPVVFKIASGTYEEQVLIKDIAGGSSTNTVTYVPANGTLGDVTIQFSSTVSADNYVIKLDNASDLIFRNLVIEATSTSFARTIWAVSRLDNILIEGCRIESPDTGGTNAELGNVRLDASISTNVRLINNQIVGGRKGVYYRGGSSSAYRAPGFEMRGNEITGPFQYGIYLDRLTEAVVEDNRVTMRATSWSSSYALELSEVEGATRVVGNRLFGARQYGLNMQFCNAEEGSPALVANNMIGSSSGGQTVFMYYNTHVNFYHNSVLNTAAGEAIQYNGTGSTGNRIKNNIFSANTGQAVYVGNSTGLVELDYNDLFTSGTYVGRWGSSYAGDVLEWRTLSSLDANSISFDPQFVSDTDLTASSPALANAGTPLAEVTTDINGVARKATPSMGANEYDSDGLSPLSGPYTINPSGTGDQNFTTIQATVDAMVLNGIAGPVVFEIAPGVYEEQVLIKDIAGGSSTNTVTYVPANGTLGDVTIQFSSTVSADNYVIKLDNASDLIFRNLVIEATSTSFARTIWAVSRLDNILIEGCRIESPDTGGTNAELGNVRLDASISTNVRLINNQIVGGRKGVYYRGGSSSAYRAPGFEMRGNEITGPFQYGIYLDRLTEAVVEDNRVTMRATSWSSSYTLELSEVEGATRVVGNRLFGARQYGLNMQFCNAEEGSPALVANNMIGSSSGGQTVFMYYNTHVNFYHNSVLNTAAGEAIQYNGTGSTGNRIKNNIFRANTGQAVYVSNSTGLVEMDYNDLFTSGTYVGRWGSSYAGDVNEWRVLSSQDANSLSFDPQFTSDTDLTASSPALANAGTPLAEVTTDINGVARKATPSMGANEYDSDGLSPLSGPYTINPSGTGDQNFTTIQATVDAMVLNGIAGPVVFEIAPGVYEEQVLINDIAGGSETNTVTYVPASGTLGDVTIQFSSTVSADNYVIKLDNASDLIFRNLVIEATSTSFARTIWAVSRLDNILIEGCRIESPDTGGTNAELGNVRLDASISTNVRLINNQIVGGRKGVYYRGGSSSAYRAPGFEMRGNEITGPFQYGIYLDRLTEAVVEDNRVTMRATSWSSSYALELSEVEGATRVVGNRLFGARQYGLNMQFCNAEEGSPALVANNMIGSSSGGQTVFMYYNTHVNFYHNSVLNTAAGEAIQYNGTGSTGNRIKNNIFRANTGQAVYVGNSTGLLEMDYNDLFTSGTSLGRWSNTYASDLAIWKSISSLDANSLNEDPLFVSDTDLTPQNPVLTEAGTDLTDFVSTDIDGNPRTVPVSIGAVEFAQAGDPLIGEYSIDPAGSGDRNFISFAAASEALRLNGVAGRVDFLVAEGTYEEQLNFGTVPGASSEFNVNLKSSSNDPLAVIIVHTDTYTMKLDNAEHYSFSSMTFKNLGTAQVVQVRNRAVNLLFENNIIESPTTTNTSGVRSGIDISGTFTENIRILNNKIYGGAYGIYVKGASTSSRAGQVIVSENELDDVYFRWIYLNYCNAPEVIGNVVNTTSSADQIAILLENSSDGALVKNNRVSSQTGNALRIINGSGSVSMPILVYNNFLQGGGNNRTVYFSNTNYLQFYHNSVWNQAGGAALEYASSGSNNDLVNNIFQGTNGYAVRIGTTEAFTTIDYNNLYTSGSFLGRWGNTDASDLESWKTTSGKDVNTLTVDPQFVSATDLTPQEEALAVNGTDLTAIVSDDINGVPRFVPVSIGAVQFFSDSGRDLALVEISTPNSACLLTDQEVVTVRISNVGSSFAGNISLSYQINEGTVVTESLPASVVLAPGQSYLYAFEGLADFSLKGDFTIVAGIIEDDEDLTNNSLEKSVTHFPEPIVTLTEDQVICKGSGVSLFATGGVSYQWSNGVTFDGQFVQPEETTTYSVLITDENGCTLERSVTVTVESVPEILFVGEGEYTDSFVSPEVGTSATEFVFRFNYVESSGYLPESGFPKLTLRSFLETRELIMIEEDATDQDVTDGKIYRVSASNLTEDGDWQSEIRVKHTKGCEVSTGFNSLPLVSSDLLDVAIFAGDIDFSNDEPALNELFTITGTIRNTSDFPAESFKVSLYVDEDFIDLTTVAFLEAQSTTEVDFDYSFTTPGYHEVKVVLDETEALDEKNELNNFAIRFYALPEGINVSASLNRSVIYPDQLITLSGVANYFGLDQTVTPKVSGATVRMFVSDGRNLTTLTNSTGGFTRSFAGPLDLGIYTVTGEVDDGRFIQPFGPYTFEVVEDDRDATPLPNLVSSIILEKKEGRDHFVRTESINGVAKVSNEGNAPAENFVFRYSSCQGLIGEVLIPILQPGEFIEYPFVTSVLNDNLVTECIGYVDVCRFTATADVFGTVTETLKSDNYKTQSFKIFGEKPDLIPFEGSLPNAYPTTFNLEDNYNFRIWTKNIGGFQVQDPFLINVYIDDVLFDSRLISDPINVCNSLRSYTLSTLFEGTEDKEVRIVVDDPMGSGAIDEYQEDNNEIKFTITYKPKKPDITVFNRYVSVEPASPAIGELFKIKTRYQNTGTTDIVVPYTNSFTVNNDGVETIFENQILNPLKVREFQSDSIITSIQSYGNNQVRFMGDSNFEIDESKETDNDYNGLLCVELSPYIDSIFDVWWGGFQIYTQQDLRISVENTGLFEAEDVSVKFYLDDVLIASDLFDIRPNWYSSIRIPHIFTEAGTYTLRVVLDEENKYIECNEGNNEYSRQITITTPGPDLKVETQFISPSKLNPDLDEQVNFFVSYENIGVVPAGSFKVRLLVDGIQLGEDVEVNGVAAGEDGTVAIASPYSSSIGGLKSVEAIVDVLEEQPDPDRRNNSAVRNIFVGDAPNLRFAGLLFSNDCPESGEEITVTAKVVNEGDLGTNAILKLYYKSGEVLDLISEESISVDPRDTIEVSVPIILLSNTLSIYAELSGANPIEFNDLDNTIEGSFCQETAQYALNTSVIGQGIVQRDPNLNLYNEGSEVTLTAIPAEGWSFVQWSGDISGSQNPYQLTINKESNVVAEFSENYRIRLKVTNESCFEAADGRLEVDIFAGLAPYSIEWYKNGELLSESGTIISNLSAGIYEVRATDSNSMTLTEEVEIIVGDFQYPIVVIPTEVLVFLDGNGLGSLSIQEINDESFDNCGIKSKFFNDGLATLDFNCTAIGEAVSVDFKVEDTNGNVSVKSFNVIVRDQLKPVLTNIPANIEISTDIDVCSAVVSWTEPNAEDNCGIDSFTSDFASGAVFPVGTTTVTYTATDKHNNTETASFTITVTDTQSPVLTAPANITQSADAEQCGAVVEIVAATAVDNCSVGEITGTRSDGKLLTDSYPVGVTTITWTVSDVNGNAAEAVVQTITVTDNQVPVLTAPANIIQTADAEQCGAVVEIVAATAVDNCGVGEITGTRSDGKLLTDSYPVGVTTITWTVSDVNGNAAEAVVQTITVTDNQVPVLTAPANIIQTADAEQCGAVVEIVAATAVDNCGVGEITGTRSDGKLLTDSYPVGVTTITWTVSDVNGNAAEAVVQTITVTDNQVPVLTAPANIIQTADAEQCGAVVEIVAATAVDNCGVGEITGTRSDGKLLTDSYPVGVTTITWTVSDVNGNAAEAVVQTITVTDNQVPVLTAPANIIQTADAEQCGAVVEIVAATAVDNCGVGEITGTRSDGKLLTDSYPVGVTTITWTVSDVNGNAAEAVVQTITVTDNQVPVITTNGDQTLNAAEGLCEASFTAIASATDNCSVGDPTGVRSDGLALTDPYPMGITTITWNVSDINNNPASEVMQTITVIDTQVPVITCPADISTTVEFGETGKIIMYDLPSVSDNCGVQTLELVSGLESGAIFPLGETTLTYRATDAAGNTAECSFTVTVTESDDNEEPVIIDCPVEVTVSNDTDNCSAEVTWTAPTATDNSSSVTLTSNFEPGHVFPVGITEVVYTATDEAGNQSTCKFNVTVNDTQVPVVITINRTFNLHQDDVLIVQASDIDDGSTDNCGMQSLELSKTSFTVADEGENLITLTVTDVNGNEAFGQAIITILVDGIDSGDLDSDGDGFTPNQGDCDDADDTVYPGAVEFCDGKDNNCDGTIDEGVQTAFYVDVDGDGFGDKNATPVFACSAPEGFVTDNSDCDDLDDTVYPGAPELCDGKDNNCDGIVDEDVQTAFYVDADEDGFGDRNADPIFACAAPEGYVTDNTDCEDLDDTVYPGAVEFCDGKDNNCDGTIDEGVQTAFYVDVDGDGFGDKNATPVFACSVPEGFVTDNSDCDDLDDTVYPGAPELCDGKDNNCDGIVDEDVQTAFYVDADEDGFGDRNADPIFACAAPEGYVTDNTDCEDTDDTVYPGAVEFCDGKDNNCDGTIDEGVQTAFYVDADGDGFGDKNATPVFACSVPEGFVTDNSDCDDLDDTVYPGAVEFCDGKDNNCDGTIDEGVQTAFYVDADGDGFGDKNAEPAYFCLAPSGYALNNTDCDDSDPGKNPGIIGSCDEDPCEEALEIISVSGPLDPIQINNPVSVSAVVSGEVVEAKWVWDNGEETFLNAPFGDFSSQYAYTTPGVYQIKLILTDECGNEIVGLTDLAVIFDPDGGFITGGGWIWSPKGAYQQDLNAEGRANFGFVAKYRKGKNIVDGNTEFQFKNGDLNFNSSSHDDMSLVIAGHKGIYKGKGSINREEGYSFMVSAIDGNLKDPMEADKFRIKIWRTDSGEIVYDNQAGSSDNADASTSISGGSIVIHQPQKGKNKSIDPSGMIQVAWNTPFEELKDYTVRYVLEDETLEIKVDWNEEGYDPLEPGIYEVSGKVKQLNSIRSIPVNDFSMFVLVMDKPMPLNISLSNVVIDKNQAAGQVIGILETEDPADDIHEYKLEQSTHFELDGNQVVWIGEDELRHEYTIAVSSTDRVGQSISKEIRITREFGANEVTIYPNPTSIETNIKVDLNQANEVTIQLFDAVGKLVFEESGYYEKGFIRNLDLRTFSAGMYQVQVQIGFQIITKRLVKNN
ncbi:HYR domain-containing protein [Algoriphagus yeomjeoni]|uniref:HYR domain-containing protein n=1 Tax=Algoriphagus yeomjeoni TaxID=291403 RepID=UPI003CE4C813